MSVRGIYLLLPALLLPTIYALTACGVDFTPPYFEVNTLSGSILLLVDSSGNLLIPSSTINFNTPVSTSLTDALILWSLSLGRPVMGFTQSETNLEGSIYENQTSLPDQNALLIYILGDLVASFTSSGDIYIKGMAVYSGTEANCGPDGICAGMRCMHVYITHGLYFAPPESNRYDNILFHGDYNTVYVHITGPPGTYTASGSCIETNSCTISSGGDNCTITTTTTAPSTSCDINISKDGTPLQQKNFPVYRLYFCSSCLECNRELYYHRADRDPPTVIVPTTDLSTSSDECLTTNPGTTSAWYISGNPILDFNNHSISANSASIDLENFYTDANVLLRNFSSAKEVYLKSHAYFTILDANMSDNLLFEEGYITLRNIHFSIGRLNISRADSIDAKGISSTASGSVYGIEIDETSDAPCVFSDLNLDADGVAALFFSNTSGCRVLNSTVRNGSSYGSGITLSYSTDINIEDTNICSSRTGINIQNSSSANLILDKDTYIQADQSAFYVDSKSTVNCSCNGGTLYWYGGSSLPFTCDCAQQLPSKNC